MDVNPSSYIYGAVPEGLKQKIQEGVDYIKKHPESLGTGDPKVYKQAGENLKSFEEKAEKVVDNAIKSTEHFFEEAVDFVKKHPDMLLAKANPKIDIF